VAARLASATWKGEVVKSVVGDEKRVILLGPRCQHRWRALPCRLRALHLNSKSESDAATTRTVAERPYKKYKQL